MIFGTPDSFVVPDLKYRIELEIHGTINRYLVFFKVDSTDEKFLQILLKGFLFPLTQSISQWPWVSATPLCC